VRASGALAAGLLRGMAAMTNIPRRAALSAVESHQRGQTVALSKELAWRVKRGHVRGHPLALCQQIKRCRPQFSLLRSFPGRNTLLYSPHSIPSFRSRDSVRFPAKHGCFFLAFVPFCSTSALSESSEFCVFHSGTLAFS
jgi:hypothetical protein